MMGQHVGQKEFFSYQVDLDRRIRADHPLRAIRARIDFRFVRGEVAHCYGHNGNVSTDPEVILKLMFLLFLGNVKSERELMRMLPERLDYLWFLGYGLDDEIPDHSVLSKARARWGQPVFESLFVRTVQQCVETGLVDGSKLHLDGSLINAHASRDSVVRSSPELITALKHAYQVEERKLEGNLGNPHYQPVNASLCSTTDPDAPCVRNNKQGGQGDSRPRYKQHRAVDDRCGVITAIVTTNRAILPANSHRAGLGHFFTQQPPADVFSTSQIGLGHPKAIFPTIPPNPIVRFIRVSKITLWATRP